MSESNQPDVNAILGTTHALLMFSRVLAHTSPMQGILLSQLNDAEQAGLATIEGLSVHEKVIESYQFAMKQIREALEKAPETPPASS